MTTLTSQPLPAHDQAQLTASSLTVRRAGRTVLDGVDLTVSPGNRLAVVGENGRGKTTLLEVLTGELAPDHGEVRRTGTLGVARQELDVAPGATVGDLLDEALAPAHEAVSALESATSDLVEAASGAEDAYARALERCEAVDAWDADRRLEIALQALSACTDRGRGLATLSVGQRYRVRLACLLGAEQDLLLLDEPTNHLDAAGLAFLTERIVAHPGGLVLVTHDRALLRAVADRILDLDPTRDGRPRTYGGGYDGWLAGRERERAQWEADHEAQQAEHRRLERSLADARSRLSTGWRPDKGTHKHQRQSRAPGVVQAVNRQRAQLEAHEITVPDPPLRFRMPDLGGRWGAPLVQVVDVTVPGRLDATVSLRLEGADRLLVTGPNGAGKSTLLALLAGGLAPTSGEVRTSRGARVALLHQESERPGSAGTAAEAFDSHVGRLVVSGSIVRDEAVGLTSLGLLDREARSTPVGRLSKGQLRRLDLAMLLASRPDVLLLDEPTNHLSPLLVDELTRALEDTGAAVVVATHDRQLLADLAHWPRLDLRSRRADSAVP